MQLPMIGERLALTLRSASALQALGLRYVYYPAPGKVATGGLTAVVFARTGDVAQMQEQIWHHEVQVQLLTPSRGSFQADINALEPLVIPIFDHFRPGAQARRLTVTGQPGQVTHCYPTRYQASSIADYAGKPYGAIDIFFDIKDHRFPGDA